MNRLYYQDIRKQLEIYFILGSQNAKKDPLETVKEALEGGITCFQFREKGIGSLQGAEKRELATSLFALCQQYHVPFIINDDVDLAIELDADGVHVGQEDEDIASVREKIGPSKMLGVSVHTKEELRRAAELADYVGIGPVFGTRSKDDAKEPAGTWLIEHATKMYPSLPKVGIGGITPENAVIVRNAGADGVAVISAIAASKDIRLTANLFK
ncbi:thiamine phosphate synthase [Mangrovibacillus cuniculi]|uniref:Thiamine-phosphate synthase n=1 Tax=Mangrovibacillus cuniculi TaxID=2593652 RepID=A0A7S8C927_9BACI|nr:thiamine phosphate synthase [Mangrovibacillus cuniculi]QPC45670.1 thiamine phosphate synthase [Mangrovibacillus cuniculi]